MEYIVGNVYPFVCIRQDGDRDRLNKYEIVLLELVKMEKFTRLIRLGFKDSGGTIFTGYISIYLRETLSLRALGSKTIKFLEPQLFLQSFFTLIHSDEAPKTIKEDASIVYYNLINSLLRHGFVPEFQELVVGSYIQKIITEIKPTTSLFWKEDSIV